MNYKEIQDLLKFISKSELSEVRIKEGEFELTVRNKNYSRSKLSNAPVVTSQVIPNVVSAPPAIQNPPAVNSLAQSKDNEAPAEDSNLLEVRSPIVGTFYRSSSPDKPPYVSVGDNISVGSVVCIVEAMKLFNEIESEVEGKIVKVVVEDASPVEYDQVLYLVDPKG